MCVLACSRVALRHSITMLRAQLLDASAAGTSAPPLLSMNGCLLDSNSAVVDGGAVALVAGAITMSNGAVSSNAAGGDGGGVSVKARRAAYAMSAARGDPL